MLMKKRPTTKATSAKREPDMQPHYDFRNGVRGKYAARYARGTNVVLLEPDIAKAFPDSASVNRALRALQDVNRTVQAAYPARRRKKSA